MFFFSLWIHDSEEIIPTFIEALIAARTSICVDYYYNLIITRITRCLWWYYFSFDQPLIEKAFPHNHLFFQPLPCFNYQAILIGDEFLWARYARHAVRLSWSFSVNLRPSGLERNFLRVIFYNFPENILIPTVCITCVCAGVDSVWEQEKLEARKTFENAAESPPSGAHFVGLKGLEDTAVP